MFVHTNIIEKGFKFFEKSGAFPGLFRYEPRFSCKRNNAAVQTIGHLEVGE